MLTPLDTDGPITIQEFEKAVHRVRAQSKAPGDDGILTGFWALGGSGAYGGRYDPSPFGAALFELVSAMFEQGVIPEAWTTSRICPIPKKGDLQDTNNWRGISLIPTGLQVLNSIMAGRLLRELESKEQINPRLGSW